MPRHLTTAWRATYREGEIIGVTPFQCCTFGSRQMVYPDAMTMAFELRVSIERERAYQAYILERAFSQQPPWTIVATLIAEPGRPKFFRVGLRAIEGSLLCDDRNLQPRPGSQIEIELKRPDWDISGGVLKLRGKVTQDIWRTDADYLAYVEGDNLSKVFSDCAWSKLQDVELNCNACFLDNPTPAGGHRAGVEKMLRRLKNEDNHVHGASTTLTSSSALSPQSSQIPVSRERNTSTPKRHNRRSQRPQHTVDSMTCKAVPWRTPLGLRLA